MIWAVGVVPYTSLKKSARNRRPETPPFVSVLKYCLPDPVNGIRYSNIGVPPGHAIGAAASSTVAHLTIR
jgi:hypothetical protein